MHAGKLRERVSFEARPVVSDGYGNTEGGTFVSQFVEPASVAMLRGGETVMAQRLSGVQPVIITVRYSGRTRDIVTSWRARDVRSGVVYAIAAVSSDEKRRWVSIVASEGPAE